LSRRKYVEGFLDRRTFYIVVSDWEMKDTAISLKIERALKAKLVVLAKQENRSLSNFIEKLLKAEVAKQESKHGRSRTEQDAD
jgi:hypothetical protein